MSHQAYYAVSIDSSLGFYLFESDIKCINCPEYLKKPNKNKNYNKL